MTAAAGAQREPLPLWRLISGVAVLGSLVSILLLLAPVYVQNSRFSARVKAVVAAGASQTDEAVKSAVVREGTALGLPVYPGDVKTSRSGGKLGVELKYVVQKSLGPYHVDLHFHPSAQAR